METARYGWSVRLGLYSGGWAMLRCAAIDMAIDERKSRTERADRRYDADIPATAPAAWHGLAVSGQISSRPAEDARARADQRGVAVWIVSVQPSWRSRAATASAA